MLLSEIPPTVRNSDVFDRRAALHLSEAGHRDVAVQITLHHVVDSSAPVLFHSKSPCRLAIFLFLSSLAVAGRRTARRCPPRHTLRNPKQYFDSLSTSRISYLQISQAHWQESALWANESDGVGRISLGIVSSLKPATAW